MNDPLIDKRQTVHAHLNAIGEIQKKAVKFYNYQKDRCFKESN